nr:MAG TPA: hypothetical protein [Caudoviricetes sp.]
MIMSEFSTLSDIFGRSAWLMIKEMDGIEVFNVDSDDRSCCTILNGREYKIARVHNRRWQVVSTNYWRTFWSQYDLLAWINDRL